VLVVDDEPGVRASFELLLEDHYTVITVPDGPSAIRAVRSCPIDCVLLDVLLPGVDGLQVLQELRSLDPTLPVIMVTAVNALRPGVTAMKLGAHDYIPKPFDEQEVLGAVAAALDWRRRQRLLALGAQQASRTPELARIVLIDEDLGRRMSLVVLLRRFGPVRTMGAQAELVPRVAQWAPTLAICDLGGRSAEIVRILGELRRRGMEGPILLSQALGDDGHALGGDLRPHDLIRGQARPDEIVRWVSEQLRAPLRAQPALSRRMSDVLLYVSAHYSGDCSVRRLAQVAELSPAHFARSFRAETGTPVRAYVTAMRLEIAGALMAMGTMATSKIAKAVGFYDGAHLTRVLRRMKRGFREAPLKSDR
jgi:DNA-binding response OmpR family regulator